MENLLRKKKTSFEFYEVNILNSTDNDLKKISTKLGLALSLNEMKNIMTQSGTTCPDDSGKTDPGICGCGVSDVDTDGAGDDYFFVYPTKLREYQARYKNSFLHGGISPEEMIVPVARLTPRPS